LKVERIEKVAKIDQEAVEEAVVEVVIEEVVVVEAEEGRFSNKRIYFLCFFFWKKLRKRW
jgi:hypothetical protein